MPKADDYNDEAYDKYLLAEVMLQKGDALVTWSCDAMQM